MIRTLAGALLFSAVLYGAPTITYIKKFPGSAPAYVSVTVERSCDTVYKETENDDYPLKFKLRDNECDAIFQMADKLDRFTRPLESGLKVAKLGDKTLRYQDGAAKHETTFNFSIDENARILVDWFDRITESEQRYIDLERAVKYEKLGVNQALLQLQIQWDKKRLAAAEQFLPLLDRIIKNDSYLHMARERASGLADAIRGLKAAKQE